MAFHMCWSLQMAFCPVLFIVPLYSSENVVVSGAIPETVFPLWLVTYEPIILIEGNAYRS